MQVLIFFFKRVAYLSYANYGASKRLGFHEVKIFGASRRRVRSPGTNDAGGDRQIGSER